MAKRLLKRARAMRLENTKLWPTKLRPSANCWNTWRPSDGLTGTLSLRRL